MSDSVRINARDPRHSVRLARFLSIAAVTALVGTAATAQSIPRLVQVGSIGCAECGGAARFATISDVTVTDSGQVLVVGSEAPTLRLFDRTGRVIWTAGRDGTGPGEYRRPMRASIGQSGIQVVDMALRRLSRLSGDGTFQSSAPIAGFPAGAAARNGSSDVVLIVDNFTGPKGLERWTLGDSGRPVGSVPPVQGAQPGTIAFPSVAVALSGDIALLPDGNVYLIHRFAASGAPSGTWQRQIERVKRTPAEIAALERIRQRAAARASAEVGRGRGAPPPLRASGSDDLKPHIAIDGLRFDDAGRLWVRTMRGDEASTILDVFAPDGRFIGEVIVPTAIAAFSLGGRWLAADTEAADGTRVVRIWEVR